MDERGSDSSSGVRPRLIARLDVKGPNLVKGVKLEGLRVLGRPEEFAQQYYRDGADEIFFQDAVASLYGRNSLLDIVERTSQATFVPLCVGGGIRSLEDIRAVLRAGADKVSINTYAVHHPEFVTQAARQFGSSTVVVSIEVSKRPEGWFEVMTDTGRERSGIDAVEWARQSVERGAGELLVTSIDRDGTGRGFEVDLLRRITAECSVPVIAHGGAGSVQDVVEVLRDSVADAVAVASMIHYHVVRKGVAHDHIDPSINTRHLRDAKGFTPVREASLSEIRDALRAAGVAVRSLPSIALQRGV